MRYLVLTDVHANLEALTSVLDDAGEYDAVLCLGDLIGYGPNPNECVNRVRALPNLICLVGNHDLAALGGIDLSSFNPFAREAAKWTAEQIDDDVREYLESLGPARLDDDQFAIAHASPRDPIWEYLEAEPQGPPNFKMFTAPVCFVGHTHVPRIFLEMKKGDHVFSNIVMPDADDELQIGDGARKIVNPGGVGQPRNGDPRAAYGVWDTDSEMFTFRRVTYPVAITQIKIRIAGLPIGLAQRLQFGI
jgi:diadenosine tetraphosphatase ApaH/serine/threonine PP2A family protein phosphatase